MPDLMQAETDLAKAKANAWNLAAWALFWAPVVATVAVLVR